MPKKFGPIIKRAQTRKGGPDALKKILHPKVSKKNLIQGLTDDRVLSGMSKCVFRAGFHWKVIYNKWPEFEDAFFGFKVKRLLNLPPEHWENYVLDRRVVRNAQKIQSVYDNALFIYETSQQHGSFIEFIINWPDQEQVELLSHLKKHGSRLGGQTGMYILRMLGKDAFLLSQDVMHVLIKDFGLEVALQPTSLRDLRKIQDQFIAWKKETDLSFTHLSQIAAFSTGQNYDAPTVTFESCKWNKI